jgi:hypothetical protein
MGMKGNGRATIRYPSPLSRFSKGKATRLSGRHLVADVPQPVPTAADPVRMHKKAAGACSPPSVGRPPK